jgi:hypothetical protein
MVVITALACCPLLGHNRGGSLSARAMHGKAISASLIWTFVAARSQHVISERPEHRRRGLDMLGSGPCQIVSARRRPSARLSSVLTAYTGVLAHRGVCVCGRSPGFHFVRAGGARYQNSGAGFCRFGCRLDAGSCVYTVANLDSFQQQASVRWPSIKGGSQTTAWIRWLSGERRLLEGPREDLPRSAVSPPELLRRVG